jgi:hypothetical protein
VPSQSESILLFLALVPSQCKKVSGDLLSAMDEFLSETVHFESVLFRFRFFLDRTWKDSNDRYEERLNGHKEKGT